MRRFKILYYSCHEILEYDDMCMLTDQGHAVFSLGAYCNPESTGLFRCPRPDFFQDGDWDAYIASGSTGATSLTRKFASRFDIAIINHMPEWVQAATEYLDCPIIYRSIGQSSAATEKSISPFRSRINIVRYSKTEAGLPGFLASDASIYFGKTRLEGEGGLNLRGDRVLTFHNAYPDRSFASAPSLAQYRILAEICGGFDLYGAANDSVSVARGIATPDEQAQAYRTAALCFYVPTVPPSYTLGFIEALGAGLPIIAPSAKFIAQTVMKEHLQASGFSPLRYEVPDLLGNSRGLLYDTMEAAQEAVDTLRNDRKLADEISARNILTFESTFDAKKIAPQWTDYISSLC